MKNLLRKLFERAKSIRLPSLIFEGGSAMVWLSNASRLLFCNSLVRFILLGVIALLTSTLLVLVIGVIAASVAGYVYDTNHVIPDPIARGDDMGSGLIMVVAFLVSLLVSLPASVLVHIYVFKKFLRGKKDE